MIQCVRYRTICTIIVTVWIRVKQQPYTVNCPLVNKKADLYGEKRMDRRQKRTRAAIFTAFGTLLEQKSYGHITVQEILDAANVGRSTFYAHFETKDALLKAVCQELFQHIVDSAIDAAHTRGLYSAEAAPESVFCHLLQHLAKNANMVRLLCGENGALFQRYFKDSLDELVRTQVVHEETNPDLPREFLVNHISGSFVEMVLWWLKGNRQYTPEELDRYFSRVIQPVLR